MDTIKYLKSQVNTALALNKSLVGLEAVLIHIERAEYMLDIGNKDEDEHFYTDVIYRTNHAYEGILKEAYSVLKKDEDVSRTPNNIETYLLNNNILNERVSKLLENYRREWRNTSTHDYHLFFNSGEAFLAILSVTSFIHILLNQIIDRLFYLSEKERIAPLIDEIKSTFNEDYNNFDFMGKIGILLKSYENNLHKNIKDVRSRATIEREFINGIVAHINYLDPTLNVELEPIIGPDKSLHPDIIISNKNGERVLIEFKLLNREPNKVQYRNFENQLLSYLTYSNIRNGILFIVCLDEQLILDDVTKTFEFGGEEIIIHLIYGKFNLV